MRIGINGYFIGKNFCGSAQIIKNILNTITEIDKKNEYYVFLPFDSNLSLDILKPRFNFIFSSKYCDINLDTKFIWEWYILPKKVEEFNLDLFYTPYFSATNFNKKIRHISSILDMCMIKFHNNFQSIKKFIIFKQNIKAGLNADHIVTISDYSKDNIKEFFYLNDAQVSNISASICKIDDSLIDDTILKKNKLQKQEYLLYIGGHSLYKNVSRLINAYLSIKSKYIKLAIVGVSPEQIKYYYKNTKLNTDKKHSILFLDFVSEEEKAALYKYCLAFIFPSLFEGFGLPPIEAMSYGAPVITSHLTSLKEVVGDAALIVDVTNESVLTNSMEKIISSQSLRDHFIEKGTLQAKKYTSHRMVGNLLNLFESI